MFLFISLEGIYIYTHWHTSINITKVKYFTRFEAMMNKIKWNIIHVWLNSKMGFYMVREQTIHLFPNVKHLTCLDSDILEAWSRARLLCFIECFSIALINVRKCFMYSGKVSRLLCPPPWTHRGSYFSLESSHNRFPCDQSTISSLVPWKWFVIDE